MKAYDKLIRVSRASINSKLFDSKGPIPKEKQPTEDERSFVEIMQSEMPQLERLKRKMSVCLDAEVSELDDGYVSYSYVNNKYTLREPTNAFKICAALDKGTLDAVSEMAEQGCILRNGEKIGGLRDGSVKTDELRLIERIATKFFFQTYLES